MRVNLATVLTSDPMRLVPVEFYHPKAPAATLAQRLFVWLVALWHAWYHHPPGSNPP